MTDAPKRCILFCAVSSEEQAGSAKMSIPDQLARQRERAARNEWLVIDEIIVEGFSRRYYTYYEFAHAAAAEGHPDPLRMFQHWERRDFNILSCRDLSRLGREQSILSEVIARTIDIDAVVMPLDEAQVDSTNYRMIGAIGGVGASQLIDNLKRYRDTGMKARSDRGQTTSSVFPMLYRADENGKLYPDRERFQRLFDDMAELFLAGTPYEQFPDELAQRGHLNPVTGKRFDRGFMRRFLHTARTWGHAEYNRRALKRGRSPTHAELWACGRGTPPADVHFTLNVSEPVWAGALGEDIKDEMERRFHAIRGGARPFNTYPFSRLCVCGDCGATMIVQTKQKPNTLYEYMVCKNGRAGKNGCHNNHAVRFDKIREYLDVVIQNWLINPAMHMPEARRQPDKLAAIDKEVSRLTARLDALIDLISNAPLSARADYQAKIDALASQRDNLHTERARVENAQREQAYTTRSRLAALESLRRVNLWAQPATAQNQILRKVLGDTRVICEDGEVVELRVIG